jgi:hypothetical protein
MLTEIRSIRWTLPRGIRGVRGTIQESIVIAMPGFLVTCVTLLMLLAGSCLEQSPAAPKTVHAPWSLQLTTSGGFAGLGRGNLSVNHEGKYDCSQMTPQDVRKGVAGSLHPARFQPISDAVAKTNPKEWSKPGLNVAAPDAFGYKLELQTGTDSKEVFTVQWYDNTKDQLPADLKKLSEVLLQTMSTSCGGTP